MPAVAPQTTIDPLGAFLAGTMDAAGRRPVPLIATSFDVTIDAGLVTVATLRRFRNAETESIEATMTFPVPVHGVLFDLEVRIDGRVLKAKAQRKPAARENYEEAITRGKTAVLHEEVLRGVHMLSVAHLAPGAEIEVRSTFAGTLACIGEAGHFRIPLTVGDIYGRSALPDSDDLVHGGPAGTAALSVHCTAGQVALAGGRLDAGRAVVPTNAPIDLSVTGWVPRDLHGRMADHRDVVLRIEPCRGQDGALDAAVLIDRSGSMGEPCAGVSGRTKHQAVVEGLTALAARLGEGDVVELWEFSNRAQCIGTSAPEVPAAFAARQGARERLLAHTAKLSPPDGGTEIGDALAAVIDQSQARDILLITDGKSYALDIQKLAQSQHRISVVLVGEDSLEANVGHLAALTGGQILVAAGSEIDTFLQAALDTLRGRPAVTTSDNGLAATRGNALLSVEWRSPGEAAAEPNRAVAAMAASLALARLDQDEAGKLAEAEGLVTHLTSLLLIDEAGAVQESLPATRKIELASPRMAFALAGPSAARAAEAPPPMGLQENLALGEMRSLGRPRSFSARMKGLFTLRPGSSSPTAGSIKFPPSPPDATGIAAQIDWEGGPNRLLAGDVSQLAPAVRRTIERMAAIPATQLLAARLKIDAVALVIGLIARSHAQRSRTANRIAQKLLGLQPAAELDSLARSLGL